MDKEKKSEEKTEQIAMLGQPMSAVPKLTTIVNFNKLDNGYIIISFFSQTTPNVSSTLIETIIVDENHAKEIVKLLQEVIDKEV